MLKSKSKQTYKGFKAPVSYQLLAKDKLSDARNVYNNNEICETRPGIKRYNSTALNGAVQSLSFFKDNSGNRKILAKAGTILQSVAASGAHTDVKTGLTASYKHRAVTLNSRHILAIDQDGLFQYDGSTFTQLGQAVPTAPSVAATTGSLTNSTYQVALTFESSTTGFETNQGVASSSVTTSSQGIAVTSIPTTAPNATIDKVNVYLKDVSAGGDFIFVTQLSLGTASYTISADPTSSQTPPTKNATPPASGKYISTYGQRIAVCGVNNFESDVFISEPFLPDAFDQSATDRTINIFGQGPITGIAEGFFNDNQLRPYLVVFKANSTTIYYEDAGTAYQSTIDTQIGCVSHDTIRYKSGVIYFLSDSGWYRIYNGRIERDSKNDTIPMAGEDLKDIFTRTGYDYELNKSNFSNFFSVYYSTFNHYMTFVSEGVSTQVNKAYNFERELNGFRPFEFIVNYTAGVEGENSDGEAEIYLADGEGYIYNYNSKNSLSDEDKDATETAINCFVVLPYFDEPDFFTTYNFRELKLVALVNDIDITVRWFKNYNLQDVQLTDLSMDNPNQGFTLDVSKLDEGILGTSRTPARAKHDLVTTSETILIGFYQQSAGANIGLIKMQMEYNKNGNDNA